MKRSEKFDIFMLCILGVISYVSFVSGFLVNILQQHVSDPLLLSLALIVKKIGKLAADIPLGMVADVYGLRRLFIYSRFLPIMSTLMLLSDSLWVIILGFILHGISLSIVVGKIEAGIYNILKRSSRVASYPKILAVLYFFVDIVAGLCAYLAAILYAKYGSNVLIYCTAITASCSIIPLIFIKDESNALSVNGKKRMQFMDVVRTLIEFGKQNKRLTDLILFWGLCNFFGGQFVYMAHVLLLNVGYDPILVAKIKGFEYISMGLGCILAFFFAHRISLTASGLLWFFNMTLMFVSSFFFNKYVLLPIMLYTFLYAMIELSVLKYLEAVSLSSIRSTITSVATLSSTIFNIVGTITFGAFAKYANSYRFGFISFCSMFMAIGLYTVIKLPYVQSIILLPPSEK